MKLNLSLIAVLCLCVAAIAQTFAPPELFWGSPVATSTSQLLPPAAHSGSLAPVELTPGVITPMWWNGSAWVALNGGAATGAVLSFNGRKPDALGNIAPSVSDYNYPMIGGKFPGVLTFNGRAADVNGDVAPATGDYSWPQIASPPTSQICASSSLSNQGFNANGCAYK